MWSYRLPLKGRLNLEFAAPRGKREIPLMNDTKLAAFVANLSQDQVTDMEKLSLVQLFSTCQLITGPQVKTVLGLISSALQIRFVVMNPRIKISRDKG